MNDMQDIGSKVMTIVIIALILLQVFGVVAWIVGY